MNNRIAVYGLSVLLAGSVSVVGALIGYGAAGQNGNLGIATSAYYETVDNETAWADMTAGLSYGGSSKNTGFTLGSTHVFGAKFSAVGGGSYKVNDGSNAISLNVDAVAQQMIASLTVGVNNLTGLTINTAKFTDATNGSFLVSFLGANKNKIASFKLGDTPVSGNSYELGSNESYVFSAFSEPVMSFTVSLVVSSNQASAVSRGVESMGLSWSC